VHVYEVRPRKDCRGVDLISDVLPFNRLFDDRPDNAIGCAMHYSPSHDAVIRVYDAIGNVTSTRAISSCNAPVSLNRQAIRQIVGYPYGFGDFHAGIDFAPKKA
jgi:hypothetical protein